mgnify:CR=1 FL=1
MKSLLTLGLCDFSFSFPPSFYVGFSRSNREIVPTFHEGLLRASRSGKNLYRLPLHFMALFLLRRFRSIRPRFLGPGLFQRGVDGGVVGFQHFLFPFQTHIDVPGGDGFKVHGEAQRRADTGEGMAQHLTDRIEVPGQLVHVRGRRVPKLVEATNGYSLVEAENDIWYDIVRGYGLRRSLFRRKGYFHGTKKQKTSTRRNG